MQSIYANDMRESGQTPKRTAVLMGRAFVALLIGIVLCACASTIRHDFGFDMRKDDQDAVVLEYRYGRDSAWIGHWQGEFKDDRVYWWESRGVDMPRPEYLYVKWRNVKTGHVFEDKVDLQTRLPRNIESQEVYFMIRGPQLYVYLITKEPHSPNVPQNGPSTYRRHRIFTLYPDSARP